MSKSGEPSVEEILESIKNVMERDSRSSSADAKRKKRADSEKDADDAATSETSDPQDEGVLDLSELELADVVDFEDDADQPLIAEEARGAMQENLAALAMLAEPGAKPQIVRSGETSLEGLTRELLRPMLAEWLDQNLPGMVEKMVQAEISRIAGKRD